MSDTIARNFFGALAFVVAVLVIGAVLSPFVPNDKEAIANVILGNVLGWPMMVLAYHYGTNASSNRKTELLATQDSETARIGGAADSDFNYQSFPTDDKPDA